MVMAQDSVDKLSPYNYEDSMTIVFLAGVHGVGKTTVATELASQLYKQGIDSYYLPERNYEPRGMIAHTPEFQVWYEREMEFRVGSIKGLISPATIHRPQVLIIDRTATDVECYTLFEHFANLESVARVAHNLVMELREIADGFDNNPNYNVNILCYNVTRPLNDVMKSLAKRMEIQEFRKDWNETDEQNWVMIRTMFFNVWNRARTLLATLQDERIEIVTLNNKDITLSVEEIMFDLEGII